MNIADTIAAAMCKEIQNEIDRQFINMIEYHTMGDLYNELTYKERYDYIRYLLERDHSYLLELQRHLLGLHAAESISALERLYMSHLQSYKLINGLKSQGDFVLYILSNYRPYQLMLLGVDSELAEADNI